MDNVIKFPRTERTRTSQLVVEKAIAEEDGSHFLLIGEDAAFMKLIRDWPCFTGFEETISLQDLFEHYYDDQLSQAQDCVLEFIFHMHDPDSVFDISNALYVWDEDDRRFFFSSLNMHAELIHHMKKEEHL
ncbi:MAG: hypothetical protein KA436_06725 [Oligoflexales bacterium]|nr:hypothetical protein [Oligoflexales bacterium]